MCASVPCLECFIRAEISDKLKVFFTVTVRILKDVMSLSAPRG